MSIPTWCERHNIDRISAQRAINGERSRISVDFAVAVERATDGKVPVSMWRSATRRAEAA